MVVGVVLVCVCVCVSVCVVVGKDVEEKGWEGR